MGHESQIELWSPNLTTFCFAGFGTAGLRRQEAMKTAGRENPNHGVAWPRNRAHGAVGQNRSRSIKWAEKQEKFQPKEMCFFLTSAFIEQSSDRLAPGHAGLDHRTTLPTTVPPPWQTPGAQQRPVVAALVAQSFPAVCCQQQLMHRRKKWDVLFVCIRPRHIARTQ